jgi:hypothetical protein
MIDLTKGTYRVTREDKTVLATVKIDGGTVYTKWDGDDDFTEDDDGMELLITGDYRVEEIS